jgi:FKBP-type peptidyl-prolyl cis-trans isomerase
MREGRRHPAEWLALLGGVSLTLALGAAGLAGCKPEAPEPPKPAPPQLGTPEVRFSYSVGAKLGSDLRRSKPEIDRDALLRGVADGLANQVALSDSELTAALQEGVAKQLERETARREQEARDNEARGRAFLAENRARPGIVSLDSGVQYEVIRAGSGETPGLEDFVTCHYRGTLLDGTVFDDTTAAGKPHTFAVTSVVDGLEQALVRMPVGSRWKIWVPAEVGYGARDPRAKVPPNSTLIFEVELLAISARP